MHQKRFTMVYTCKIFTHIIRSTIPVIITVRTYFLDWLEYLISLRAFVWIRENSILNLYYGRECQSLLNWLWWWSTTLILLIIVDTYFLQWLHICVFSLTYDTYKRLIQPLNWCWCDVYMKLVVVKLIVINPLLRCVVNPPFYSSLWELRGVATI